MSGKEEEKQKSLFSRRDALKMAGLVGLGAGFVSVARAGFINGKSFDTYSGWEGNEGKQYFDRTPFQVDTPPYKILRPEIKRIEGLDAPSDRHYLLKQLGLDKTGLEGVSGALKEYYDRYPDKLVKDKMIIKEINPRRKEVEKNMGNRFVLSEAWNNAWAAVKSPQPGRPEVHDWEGVRKKPYKIKDPKRMSDLIKKVSHTFGASLVGIARLNPAWVYATAAGTRGYAVGEPINVPEWWQYAIVVGTPHEWDSMLANPTYASEVDAAVRSNMAAARLEAFIKQLGYPARVHGPDFPRFDVVIPPIMVDAGLGEQGRFSFVLTPEFGGNIRPAVVTTSLPLQPDKPIDIGVRQFCKHCKLCAEICPPKVISFDDSPGEMRGRGVEGWFIDVEGCIAYRQSVPSSQRCRLCLTVCPWSRKGNWIHQATKQILPRERSGLTAKTLTWAQRAFYDIPDISRFKDPEWGSYREAPWFFRAEDFIES